MTLPAVRGHVDGCNCSAPGPVADTAEPTRVCARLVEAGVHHCIVGGWAAVLHGVKRVPHDLDVVVRPWQLPRIEALVADLGYAYVGPLEVHDPGTPRERRCRKMLRDLGDGRHLTLDFLAESGPFAGAIARRNSREGLWVVRKADLIRMKRLAGRTVDLEDLATLDP